jgi:hypothetical protein
VTRFLLFFLFGLQVSLIPVLDAASIAQVDARALARQSQLIFQGEVLATRAEQLTNGRIYSFVDFQVEEVLAGNIQAGSVLTLRFAGGSVGDLNFSAGVVIPRPGERGIYFVESANGRLINPLLGWSQGHFRIDADSRVLAGNGEVVVGIGLSEGASPLRLSRGVARGVETRSRQALAAQPRGLKRVEPITVDDFKAGIRALRSGGVE